MNTDRVRLWAALACVLVLILAAAVRLPNLQTVPHLTDEAGEVLWAYDVAHNGVRPLTHNDSYNGPLWTYLMAAIMRAAGTSVELPRQAAAGLGLVTVGLTLALGAALARSDDRLPAAIVSGALIATGFTHAIVNSRVPWSNSSTPLWTTLCALALLSAVRARSGPLLVVTGLLCGLALNTHPSVVVYLAALAVWFLLDAERRSWLKEPWPWLAAVAAVVGYSPVIYYNLTTGLDTLDQAGASRNVTPDATVLVWLSQVGALVAQLGRSMAGGFLVDGIDESWRVVSWVYALAAVVAALALFLRHGTPPGRRLPAIVLAVALVCLPLINRNWTGFLEARYLGYLWPLLYSSAGVLAIEVWRKKGLGVRVTTAAILIAACVLPWMRVRAYDASALEVQFDNRRLWSQLAAAETHYADGSQVFVDRSLKQVKWRAGGQPRRAVEYMLTLEGVRYVQAPEDKINHFLSEAGDGSYVLFLSGPSAEVLGSRYPLVPLDVDPRPGEEAWGLYYAPPSK